MVQPNIDQKCHPLATQCMLCTIIVIHSPFLRLWLGHINPWDGWKIFTWSTVQKSAIECNVLTKAGMTEPSLVDAPVETILLVISGWW
jgi:hypothetical protein